MTKTIFIILALFFVAILQTTFMPKLSIYGVFPNLMLIVIIYKSLFKEYKEIFIWPLVGGIVLDVFSATPFGVFTLSFLIVSLIINFLSRNIWTSENVGLVVVIVVLLGSLVFGFSNLSLTKLAYLLMSISWTVALKQALGVIFAETACNIGLAAVLFFVLRKLDYAR